MDNRLYVIIVAAVLLCGMILVIDGAHIAHITQDSRQINQATDVIVKTVVDNEYKGSTGCDEKLSLYYDQFLLCLQSIPSPELLRVDYAEPANEVSKCNNQLNWDYILGGCFYQSDYRFIYSICRTIHDFQGNEVLYQLELVPCIQHYDYLIGSGSGIIETRKQLDGSSFVMCSSNYDCLSDEFCSIQGVQRCEKIVSSYYDNITLVDAKQMEEIIRDNDIKSSMENHSRVNSVTLIDGRTYVVRDISVDSLILKYNKKNVQQWIE